MEVDRHTVRLTNTVSTALWLEISAALWATVASDRLPLCGYWKWLLCVVLWWKRHYEDVEGLLKIRRSRTLERYVGAKSKTSGKQYRIHQSPMISDCFYRNMYRFQRISVIDYDEVGLLKHPAIRIIRRSLSVQRWLSARRSKIWQRESETRHCNDWPSDLYRRIDILYSRDIFRV